MILSVGFELDSAERGAVELNPDVAEDNLSGLVLGTELDVGTALAYLHNQDQLSNFFKLRILDLPNFNSKFEIVESEFCVTYVAEHTEVGNKAAEVDIAVGTELAVGYSHNSAVGNYDLEFDMGCCWLVFVTCKCCMVNLACHSLGSLVYCLESQDQNVQSPLVVDAYCCQHLPFHHFYHSL